MAVVRFAHLIRVACYLWFASLTTGFMLSCASRIQTLLKFAYDLGCLLLGFRALRSTPGFMPSCASRVQIILTHQIY